MYEISKQFRFESAHTLERSVDTAGSRRIHGHSYRAEVTMRGLPDPETGMIVDLGLLERTLETVRGALDHHFLNDVDGLGPATLENLAAWIWRKLVDGGASPARVIVYRDAAGESCLYDGPDP
jgi:6-pyruvoyltetrahydropterin/6-carboxytetrahydropterin synthase